MGVSFSIPIDVAMEVADQLKEKGSVSRGWLGVVIQEVNRDLAESFGLSKPAGALVAQVLPDSPASAAGFQAGDVILEFNGREIGLSAELPAQVGRVTPGEEASVSVYRFGERLSLTVKIGVLPTAQELAENTVEPTLPEETRSLGVTVKDIDTQLAEQLNVDSGVYVEALDQGPASAAGVRKGDVITMLAGQPVTNVESLQAIVSDLVPSKPVPIRVIRGGNPVFLALRVE